MVVRVLIACVLLTTSCLLTSGCGLTLGPKEATRTLVIRAGKPGVVARPSKVWLREISGKVQDEQWISGWVVMPPDHYNVIARKLGLPTTDEAVLKMSTENPDG